MNSDEASIIELFEAGADQYLPKLFSAQELLMRLKSLLRRVSLERTRYKYTIPCDEFERKTSSLPFTSTQGELVNYLMLYKGKAVSKEELQLNVLNENFMNLIEI